MNTKNAFGYIRASNQGQHGADDVARQEQAIRQYAARQDVAIAAIYVEKGGSGPPDEVARPAFREMVAAMPGNGVGTVIIAGMDRLAREPRIQETLSAYLASKDIRLIDARTGEDLATAFSSDPIRKTLVQIQGVFAELEKNLQVKKLCQARAAKKAATGKCEGRKGYTDSTAANRELVREIKRLRRKPRTTGKRRRTFQQIAGLLNEQGRLTMDGKVFTAKNVSNIIYRHKGRV